MQERIHPRQRTFNLTGKLWLPITFATLLLITSCSPESQVKDDMQIADMKPVQLVAENTESHQDDIKGVFNTAPARFDESDQLSSEIINTYSNTANAKTKMSIAEASIGTQIVNHENEILAEFKSGLGKKYVSDFANSRSMKVVKHYETLSAVTGKEFVLLAPAGIVTSADLSSVLEEMESHPSIGRVSSNNRNYISATPNDEHFFDQWGLHNTGQLGGIDDADIDAPEAWDYGSGDSEVIVAVLDTGVNYLHDDLIDNMWTNNAEISGIAGVDDDGNGYVDDIYGMDAAGDNSTVADGDPMDTHGHGSHCAGVIGATGDNGIGVTGVNWDVRIMGMKVSPDNEETVDDSHIINAIDYLLDQIVNYGQNIVAVNASWGSAVSNTVLRSAIKTLGNTGVVWVTAAGNDQLNIETEPSYPASYNLDCIISVAATDDSDLLADFSNWGATSVDLGAPGVDVLSTVLYSYIPDTGYDIFMDDMESSSNNWTTGGSNNSWGISADQEIFENEALPVPSPSHFWSDSPGGEYAANVNSWLELATPLDLSAYAGIDISLGFYAAAYIEDYFDHGYVEISSDGGNQWAILYDFTGAAHYWSRFSLEIPESYKTTQFKIRFRLVSDYTVQYPGWLIDDIGIGFMTSQYESNSGTSMATPYVTGAVALMASMFPTETVAQRKERILQGVDVVDSLIGKTVTNGRLNLKGSADYIQAGCATDADCNDFNFCNGIETCDLISGQCAQGEPPCADDGLFCNGQESCNENTDSCDATDAPCADDGLFCNGQESCNENTDSCDATDAPCADDGLFCNGQENCNENSDSCDVTDAPCADDGLFCNGQESCNETADVCMVSNNPCETFQACDELEDECIDICLGCLIDDICYDDEESNPDNPCEICLIEESQSEWTIDIGASCDDTLFCNGLDSCSTNGTCSVHTGAPCAANDGLFCNGIEGCDEENNICLVPQVPCEQDDGQFCNGIEGCDESNDECQIPAVPCDENDGLFCNGEEGCDEIADICLSPVEPCIDDGLFCNGMESCDENTDICLQSAFPCDPDASCNETADNCTEQCNGCDIDSVCHSDQAINPQNQCEGCDVMSSMVLWTPLDNIECSDENDCTDYDQCANGVCMGSELPDWTDCGGDFKACFSGSCEHIPMGDSCDDAISISTEVPYPADFEGYHTYATVPSSCGPGELSGVDVFFEVTLAGGTMYDVEVTPSQDSDVAIAIWSNCSMDLEENCYDAVNGYDVGEGEVTEPFFMEATGVILIQVINLNKSTLGSTPFTVVVKEVSVETDTQIDTEDSDNTTNYDTASGNGDTSDSDTDTYFDSGHNTGAIDVGQDTQTSFEVDSETETDSDTDTNTDNDSEEAAAGCGCATAGAQRTGAIHLFKLLATLL